MFHFREEGEKTHWGINWMKKCQNTAWAIRIKIPIWFYKKILYQDFDSDNVVEGCRALCLTLRVRRRAKDDFPEGHQLWLFSKSKWKEGIGKQKLIYTREQLEDMMID